MLESQNDKYITIELDSTMALQPVENNVEHENASDTATKSKRLRQFDDTPTVKKIQHRTKQYTSIIHSYFDYDETADTSKCKVADCKTIIARKFPTNLCNHIKAKHKDLYEKFVNNESFEDLSLVDDNSKTAMMARPSKTMVDYIGQKTLPIKKGTKIHANMIEKLAACFVRNSLPYMLVEDAYFIDLMKYMAQCGGKNVVDLPNRRALKESCAKLVSRLKANISTSLSASNKISVTIDLWSRPGYSAAYAGITCHYIACDKLNRCLLACQKIEQPHTAEKFFELYQAVLGEWHIPEMKVFKIVTDNGANIVKAFRYVFRYDFSNF